MFKHTFIFVTSYNTTCLTELGQHSTLQFPFGMLHRALELTVSVECEDPEVLGTAAARHRAHHRPEGLSTNKAVQLLSH